MSIRKGVSRRNFLKVCGSFTALLATHSRALAKQSGPIRHYNRVMLVDEMERPLALPDLEVGEGYIFHYPFIATPCFLIDLGTTVEGGTRLETENGESYRWRGGSGPRHSIVAFSAICSHKMSHPSRQVSFINYRNDQAQFLNKQENLEQREQVIYCCSEKSVYDPKQGARVLGGPAPQPLACIALEYDDERGLLYAVGTYGGEMFHKFLTDFAMRLSLEYRTPDIDDLVADQSKVIPSEQYCNRQILC
jgi:Rieske Fe-S protein